MAALEARTPGLRGFVISDSGFTAEAAPVVARYGAEHCLLIRVHAEARGCSFAGDSRSFIALPGVAARDLHNDGPDPDAFGAGGARGPALPRGAPGGGAGMTWLLLILYVNGAGHSPATLTSIRDFRNVAACEAAAALERRIPARFLRARGSVTLLCVPQHGSRRHG